VWYTVIQVGDIVSFNEEKIEEKSGMIRCVQVILIITEPEFPTCIVIVYMYHRRRKVT
jgi:hypothetical protein